MYVRRASVGWSGGMPPRRYDFCQVPHPSPDLGKKLNFLSNSRNFSLSDRGCSLIVEPINYVKGGSSMRVRLHGRPESACRSYMAGERRFLAAQGIISTSILNCDFSHSP